MPTPRMTKEMAQEAIDAALKHGSIRAGAKAINLNRQAFQSRLTYGEKIGLTKVRQESNPSRWRPGEEIVKARKAEFERVKASGPLISGNTIFRPDDGPFMVVMLGDEHLDNPGTDLDLWERWISVLNRAKHITGWSLGDMLDSWARPLAHLYGNAETPAPEGWILLQHYMEQIGEDLDGSIGGNHDKWAGANDVLAMVMEQYGVMHRNDSLRVAYRTPSGREVTVNARHTWPGRSQWNEVHAIKKAARMGIRDTILVGGHTHVSGDSMEKDPMNGKISFCYQVASFKLVDDYADTCGFMDRNVAPAIALVIDPRRADNDPELVKHFYDPRAAERFLTMLRRDFSRKAA